MLHADLDNTLLLVQGTMVLARQLKNAAFFRNLTSYRPKMYNRTLWLGKFDTLQRFCGIPYELVQVCNEERSTLKLD